jgi:hypothetical protein
MAGKMIKPESAIDKQTNKNSDRSSNRDNRAMISAQKKFNKLCEEHGLKPWKIDAKKGNWKELCLRIVGVPELQKEKKRPGRKPHDQKLCESVWYEVHSNKILNSFKDLTLTEKNFSQQQKTRDIEIFHRAAKKHDIEPKRVGNHQKISKPEDIVKGIYQREKKRQLREREEDDNR